MTKGAILFHHSFKFKDGEIGEKLIVVLNNPNLQNDEPYLVCRTTSKEGKRKRKPACDIDQSTFFIPEDNASFRSDTWLQLYEIYEIDAQSLLNDRSEGQLDFLDQLPQEITRQLMNCLKNMEDISIEHLVLIFKF